MSKEINEIINNLCEKLGTSAKFLIPELARMHIAQGIFSSLVSAVIFIICIYYARKAWAYDHRDDNSMWENDSCWIILPMVVGMGSFVWLSTGVYELIGWITSPTAMAIKEIARMVK